MTARLEDRTAAVIVAVISKAAPTLLPDLERTGHDVSSLRAAALRAARRQRPDPEPVTPAWLTVEQAAAALGTTKRTVQRWCVSGRLTARRDVAEGACRGVWEVEAAGLARLITGRRSQRRSVAR